MAAERKYADLDRDEITSLLEARDRCTRLGLFLETNEIERDAAAPLNFTALICAPS